MRGLLRNLYNKDHSMLGSILRPPALETLICTVLPSFLGFLYITSCRVSSPTIKNHYQRVVCMWLVSHTARPYRLRGLKKLRGSGMGAAHVGRTKKGEQNTGRDCLGIV